MTQNKTPTSNSGGQDPFSGSPGDQPFDSDSDLSQSDPKSPSKSPSKSQSKNPKHPPKKAKFGGLKAQENGTAARWSGGKPLSDWSGLEDPNPLVRINQYRSGTISHQAKSHQLRTQGLETKFTRTSDLLTFQKNVFKHLVNHGLDTVSYLPDPMND